MKKCTPALIEKLAQRIYDINCDKIIEEVKKGESGAVAARCVEPRAFANWQLANLMLEVGVRMYEGSEIGMGNYPTEIVDADKNPISMDYFCPELQRAVMKKILPHLNEDITTRLYRTYPELKED